MKKNVQKYTGVLLVSSVLIGGIASAAITPAFPGTLPNAVSGAVIKASDINTLVTAVNNLNQRVPANLEQLTLTEGTSILKNTGTNANIESWTYSDTSTGDILGLRARGTEAAPTALQAGDVLTTFKGIGYGATKWLAPHSGMNVKARENFTDTAGGTELEFRVVSNGTVSTKTQMYMNADSVGINTSAPSGRLHINYNTDVDLDNDNASFIIGNTRIANDYFLQMDGNEMQSTRVLTVDPATGAKTYGANNFLINAYGGEVQIAANENAHILDAGVDNNKAAFSIGPLSAPNDSTTTHVEFDNNEIQAVKIVDVAGTETTSPSNLLLNFDGGSLNLSRTIQITNPDNVNANKQIAFVGVKTFADNTAAKAGGLVAGDIYRTATGVIMIVY